MIDEVLCGIYSITNTKNGKRYIGRSVNIQKRFVTHQWRLNNNHHFNPHLQRAWNICSDDFTFDILELCESESLNEREIYWIYKHAAKADGYNICSGGNGTTGRPCTESAKKKISAASTGRKDTDETKRKKSEASKAMWKNPKTRESILKNRPDQTGKKCRPHTEEEKQNLSEKLKGKYVSEEHKERLRELYSGENSLSAKLSTSDIVDIRIRFLTGERQIDIQKKYRQITPQTIYDIVRNRRWNSVPNTLDELLQLKRGCA